MKPIPPDGGLNDADRIQVFRKFGIQVGNDARSLNMIVDELDEGEGNSRVLDDSIDFPHSVPD